MITNFPTVEEQIIFIKRAVTNKNVGYNLNYLIYYYEPNKTNEDTVLLTNSVMLEEDYLTTQDFLQQQFELAMNNLVENIFTQCQIRNKNIIEIQLPDESGYFFYEDDKRFCLTSLVGVKFN